MKTITITVVCLVSMCTACFSQKYPGNDNILLKGINLFPAKVNDMSTPKNVILNHSIKEKNSVNSTSDYPNRLNQTYFFIIPVNYYTTEKKYNLIN